MRRLLAALGLDLPRFRALLGAYLLMDLRSQHFARATGSRERDRVSPLFWIVAQYLFIGAAGSALLFERVDAEFFATANLAMGLLIVATAVTVEFGEIVVDEADLRIVAALPVPPTTYSAARLTNLLLYVVGMIAALATFPAIAGVGLADGGWTFLPAYAAAASCGGLAVAGAVIWYYLAARPDGPSHGTRDVLAWTQIIAVMVLVYGGQAMFRDPRDSLEMWAYDPPDWLALLPPAWLGQFVRSTGPDGGPIGWSVLVGHAAIAGALWLLVLRALTRRYAAIDVHSRRVRALEGLPALPAPGSLVGGLGAALLAPGGERAGYGLSARLLARDGELVMRSMSQLATLPLLAAIGYAANKLGDPWLDHSSGSALSVAAVYAVGLAIPPMWYQLRFSRQHAGAWLLASAPLADPAALFDGCRKAVLWRGVLPVLAGLCGVLGALWGRPDHAALLLVAGWLVAVGCAHGTVLLAGAVLPFSRPPGRGEMSGPAALAAAVVGGIAMSLGALHHLAARSAPGTAVYLAALAIACAWLGRAARRAVRRRHAGAAWEALA